MPHRVLDSTVPLRASDETAARIRLPAGDGRVREGVQGHQRRLLEPAGNVASAGPIGSSAVEDQHEHDRRLRLAAIA